jgi:hypothetical protein
MLVYLIPFPIFISPPPKKLGRANGLLLRNQGPFNEPLNSDFLEYMSNNPDYMPATYGEYLTKLN